MCRTPELAEELDKLGEAKVLGCFGESKHQSPWKEGREIIRKGCFRVVYLMFETIANLEVIFQCSVRKVFLVRKRLSYCVKPHPLGQLLPSDT